MDDTKKKEENKKLIEKYPFLWPVDYMGKKIEDYDYTFTFLDDMPSGWKRTFGKLLCEDLKEDLEKNNYLDKYSVSQVKEKYNELRWYSNGVPETSDEHIIIEKYAHISSRTCHYCGKFPVPIIDDGWIQAVCKECYDKHFKYKKEYEDFIIDDSKFDPKFKISRFSTTGTTTTEYDTSDIIKRMRHI